jgi:hypothetical protein
MIEINVKPGGKTVIVPTGYGGDLCRNATKPYVDALLGKVVSDKDTEEAQMPAYAHTPQTQSQRS